MKKGRGITRWIAVMVAVFIAVLTVVPAGFSFFGTETYAEIKKEDYDDATGRNVEHIVTGITGLDLENNPVEDDPIEAKHWTKIGFRVEFSIEDGDTIDAGDYFIINWPDQSENERVAAITPHDNHVELEDEDVKYADAYITDKGAIVIFTNGAHGHHTINGFLSIWGRIKKNKNMEEEPDSFTITVNGKELEYKVLSSGDQIGGDKDLDKQGSQEGAEAIAWSLNINETAGNKFGAPVTINDTIPINQELADGHGYMSLYVFTKKADGEWMTVEDYRVANIADADADLFKRSVVSDEYPSYDEVKDFPIALLYYDEKYPNVDKGHSWVNHNSGYVAWSYKKVGDSWGNDTDGYHYLEISDYLGTGAVTKSSNSLDVTIPQNAINDHHLKLEYITRISDSGLSGEYKNTATMTCSDVTSPIEENGNAVVQYNASEAGITGLKYNDIQVTKTLASTGAASTPLSGIYFKITKNGDDSFGTKYIKTNSDGLARLTSLKDGTYYVQEMTEADAQAIDPDASYPENLKVDTKKETVKIGTSESTTENNDISWTNTIGAMSSVKLTLTGSKTLTGDDITEHTGEFEFSITPLDNAPLPEDFSNPVTNDDNDGQGIYFGEIEFTKAGTYKYTVAENTSNLPDGIVADGSASKTITVEVGTDADGSLKIVSVTGDSKNILNVNGSGNVEFANKKVVPISIEGTKTWYDGGKEHDNVSEVKLILKRKSANVTEETVEVTPVWDGNKYTYSNMPKYDDNGDEYTYSVTESKIDGYRTTQDGYDIVNTITGTTDISGTKTWVDGGKMHDNANEVALTLKRKSANSEAKEETVTATPSWEGDKYTYSKLPKYDSEGYEYTYTVTEAKAEGYEEPVYSGEGDYDITNTITGTTAVSGIKTWKDENNRDGKRPESIIVRLHANGSPVEGKVATVKADAEGKWKYSFTNLPKYDDNGSDIIYTVTEDAVDDYSTGIIGYNITNTYTPGETSLSVTKKWSGDENDASKRPASVTIKLLADGEETGKTIKLTAANNWSGEFEKLDEYKDGNRISYTIEEVTVSGYEVEITGDAKEGYTVTNKYNPSTEPTEPAKYPVKVNKTDLDAGEEIDGAKIRVTGPSGYEKTWTSRKGETMDMELTPGSYTLVEVNAPEGYQKVTTEIQFTVGNDGTVTLVTTKVEPAGAVNQLSDGTIVLSDAIETQPTQPTEPEKYPVKVNKTDLDAGEEIDGAKIKVTGPEGYEKTWTSRKGETMDMELTPGSYTLVEVNAPEGYQKVTTEIKFTVGNDGTVTLVTTKVEPAGAVNQLEDGTIILSDATTPELPRLPGIATTVNANGNRASEEKAVHVTYNETFSPVSISDTVEYINLLKGVTYTVTGTLVKIDANGKIIDPDVKTVTVECEAKDTFGTWTIDFDGVTLEPLAKYVVFESVYAAGGEDETVTKDNPVTHKDVNDKAQTILTEDENGKTLDDVEEGENQSQESSSSDDASKEEDETEDTTIIRNQGKKTGKDSPDTGDSPNTALYVTIAAAAAGIAVTSVMLGTGRKRGRR